MKNPRLSILMIALIGCTVYFMTTGNFRPVVIANSDEYNTLTAAEALSLIHI